MNTEDLPILCCSAAAEFEEAYFGSGQETEEAVMYRAGRSIAAAIEDDFEEVGGLPTDGIVLVLAGKGHNAGDAFICANTLLDRHPALSVHVLMAFSPDDLKPNVRGPFELLRARARVTRVAEDMDVDAFVESLVEHRPIDLCLDGLLGMNFRPPLDRVPRLIVDAVNRCRQVRVRAAVDLPSGLGDVSDPGAFRADFTYATGIVKEPVTRHEWIEKVGRVRFLDLDFFRVRPDIGGEFCVLKADILYRLASLRETYTDKRRYGHLAIVAGSSKMPGACLLSTLGACNSGVGLVTVGTVDTVAVAGTVVAPEAMWAGVPGSSGGFLDGRVMDEIATRANGFTALLAGPGLGRDEGVRDLVERLILGFDKPLILDADGLLDGLSGILARRPEDFAPVILTPHLGEWKRIGGEALEGTGCEALRDFCARNRCLVVLKGPRTKVASKDRVLLSPFGGPVLARGGTGDILSGLVGSLVAQHPGDLLDACATGAVWHGRAADCLARAQGNWAVRTTQLLDFLPEALGF